MPNNLLEQLGEQDVPRPPRNLRANVRERMNATLVFLQMLDLLLRGVPYCLWHFGAAVTGLIFMTLTGNHEPPPRQDARLD